MEDFYMNTSRDGSFNNSNVTFSYSDDAEVDFIRNVLTYIIVSIGLPLTLVAIYALYLLVRDGDVAPIYIINLLIADLFQLCSMIAWPARDINPTISPHFYRMYCHCVVVSVGFMVCVALERYLVVAHPLWYRFSRTIKSSVAICVVVWVLPAFIFPFPSAIPYLLLLPFPLLIFFLVGTVKALSATISVPSDEKRRIVGTLVLVLLIYTLLFLPLIILILVVGKAYDIVVCSPASLLVHLSPLADLLLYVFIKKGIIDKFLAFLCCCRMDSNDTRRAGSNDISRKDSNNIRNYISRKDSNKISNDICRMHSNGISHNISRTDSNISREDSNDVKRAGSNYISRTDSNIISKDIRRMDSNDISRMDSNIISNDIRRMDSNDISRMDSNIISNDIRRMDSNNVSRMESNDTSSPSV